MRRISLLLSLFSVIAISTSCRALDVLVNQVGYEPNAPKVFRVQRATDFAGSGTFQVKKASDNLVVYSGSLTRKGSLWDKYYWEGDLSSCRIPGDYYVSATVDAESGNSFNFTINSNTRLSQTGVLNYQYFTTQRCGTNPTVQYFDRPLGITVTWHHNTCHLDDGGICMAGSGSTCTTPGAHLDATGGWHDAGDYNKFCNGFAAPALEGLLWAYDANRSYYDAIDVINNTGGAGSNGIPDLLDEAIWQARWLAKMVDSTDAFGEGAGHTIYNTRRRKTGSSFVVPEADSDNTVGTSDDRWLDVGDDQGDSATPQEVVCCAALIKTHRVLASKGIATENFGIKALDIWNHKVQQAIAGGGHNNLGTNADTIWAGLDLYAAYANGQLDSTGRAFDRTGCYNRVLQKVDEISSGIVGNPARNDDIGLAEGPGTDLGALAWFARNYPATAQAITARTAVQTLMTHYLTLTDDPIGLIKRSDPTYGGGQLQYFPTNPDSNKNFLGQNRMHLYLTFGALEAYKLVGNAAYLRFAEDQYSWVMGANYDRVCQMDAAGSRNLTKYHSRYYSITPDAQNIYKYGKQPGVVPNGYVRVYATGLPNVDMSSGSGMARYQSNEGWLVNNAAYGMALSAMTAYESSSQIISSTIPSQMYTNQSLSVSVTVKNTGYIPWTQAGEFKLGAVDDTDPFAPSRVILGGSESVSHNQQKSFTFTITAPSTPGTYTTDWRMMQENVSWFGDTLTKQVQVTVGPPGPVTSFTATAGDKQVLLSWHNPANSNFTKTMIRYKTTSYPTSTTDGTELVDQANSPNSNDTYLHEGLVNNRNYLYAAFAHDDVPQYSTRTIAIARPMDTTPPGVVTSFKAASGDGAVSLSWVNPTDADFAGAKVLFKTTDYPATVSDGTQLYSGTGTSCQHTGLANGTRLFYAAFACDAVPNYSLGAKTKTTPAVEATISQAKTLGDGQLWLLKGKTVSAAFDGSFYMEESNHAWGLKAFSSEPVVAGNLVDLVGVMGGSGDERYIDTGGDQVIVTTPGPGAPPAIGLGCISVGGSDLIDASTPGVPGRQGPNNVGLLVRIWGAVSDVTSTSFRINDGSAFVKVLSGALTEPTSAFAVVTGVVTLDEPGVATVKPREQADIAQF